MSPIRGTAAPYATGVPAGEQFIGPVPVGIEGGICCGLKELTERECLDMGGQLIGDPGDGSVYRDGCPRGQTLLGSVPVGIEGSICCQ